MSVKRGTGDGFAITGRPCAICGSVRGTTPGCVCTHDFTFVGSDGSTTGRDIGGDWKGKAIGGYIDAPLSGWQPIETAPRDKWLLIFSSVDGCHVASWSDHLGGWEDGLDGYGEPSLAESPTHWMFLPDSPA